MKRFVSKTILFALLLTVSMTVVAVINKRYFFADNYLNEFPVKQQLISSTPSPKMVVIGGSNVAFGIDSKTLSDSLGIPVVNAGLHAGLGLRYIMNANTPLLRKGDILVIMPEYCHFFNRGAYGGTSTISVVPYFATAEDLQQLCGSQLMNVARGFCHATVLMLFKGAYGMVYPASESSTFRYLKSGFDERGDEVSHCVKPTDKDMTNYHCSPSFTEFNEEYISEFISLVHDMECRGIRVLLLPPAILDTELASDRPMIDALVKRFRSVGIPYQAPLDTFAYPAKYLYNSSYHLNADGVVRNTHNVLTALKGER